MSNLQLVDKLNALYAETDYSISFPQFCYQQGRQDAVEDVKAIVNHWLIHESGKCLECGNRLSADLEKLKEKQNDQKGNN